MTCGIRMQQVVHDHGQVRPEALRSMDATTQNTGTFIQLPILVGTQQMKMTVGHVHGECVRKVGTSEDEGPCTYTFNIMWTL